MSEIRRYRATVDWEEHDYGAFVRYDDYFALLAVLRQCVKAMEDINRDFAMAFIASGGHKETNEALAAAREYTEAK